MSGCKCFSGIYIAPVQNIDWIIHLEYPACYLGPVMPGIIFSASGKSYGIQVHNGCVSKDIELYCVFIVQLLFLITSCNS